MAAVYVSNLVVNAGSDFSQTFNLEEISTNSTLNLDGYTAFAQMRKWSGSSNAINFSTDIPTSSAGTIVISLTGQQTENIKPGRYVYDIVILDAYSVKNRIIEGMVIVREGVTR